MRLNFSFIVGFGFGNSKVLWILRSGVNENVGYIVYGCKILRGYIIKVFWGEGL